jgi:hypothetical protein
MTMTYRVEGATPSLSVPTELTLPLVSTVTRRRGLLVANRGEGIALCGDWTVAVVDETADGVVVIDGPHGAAIVAYHPADAVVWYTRKDACERALAPAKGPSPVAKWMLPPRAAGC